MSLRDLLSDRHSRPDHDPAFVDADTETAYRLPIIYADNDVFMTRDATWTAHRIPPKPWGFLSTEDVQSYYYAPEGFLDRMFPAEENNAGHLLLTNRVHSAELWRQNLIERYRDDIRRYIGEDGVDTFGQYIAASHAALNRQEFFDRDTYLFTRLGSRGPGRGIVANLRSAAEYLLNGAGLDDSQPTVDELEFWVEQAEQWDETISSSWLNGRALRRDWLERIVRQLDTPGLPTPDIAPADKNTWGAGEWRTVLASTTHKVPLGQAGKYRLNCVRYDGPTGTSYAAYLPLSHCPERVGHDQTWLHHASSLPFPVDVSLHFEIINHEQAEKELEKPIFAAEAQADEDREAGYTPDEATQFQNQMLREVKMRTRMGRIPLAFWQAVFCVYDTNKEMLLRKVTRLQKHYSDIHFQLECPPKDQRELYYQSQPGSDLLIKDWIQKTDPAYLAAAMPWLTTSVGDGIGLYQGNTVVADAQGHTMRASPVLHDLQNVADDAGQAPTEVVAADSGSGKTVGRGLKVCHEDALRGVTQAVWDPKGDFRVLKHRALELGIDPAKVRLIELGELGCSLDAFAIAEVNRAHKIDQRSSLAIEVLTTLCHAEINDPQDGRHFKNMIREAVNVVLVREATTGERATMVGVFETFARWRRGDFAGADVTDAEREHWTTLSRSIHTYLEQEVMVNKFGRLLFLDPGVGTMTVTPGTLTVFVALNMQLPEADPEKRKHETRTTTLIITELICGLMTDYIRSMLASLPPAIPKAAVFDEWHVVRRTNRAETLADWLKRMGRSRRCTVRQLSQSANDFDSSASLSTIWCGKVQSEEEARASCKLIGLEQSRNNLTMLQGLAIGQFLFKDVYGRIARVDIDMWDPQVLEWFNTQAKDQVIEEPEPDPALVVAPDPEDHATPVNSPAEPAETASRATETVGD